MKTIKKLFLGIIILIVIAFASFSVLFGPPKIESIEDIEKASKFSIDACGELYRAVFVLYHPQTTWGFFWIKPINDYKFKKTHYYILGSVDRFNNLIREFDYIENRQSRFGIVLQAIGNEIKDAASGTWNMIRHPIDTALGMKDIPAYLYKKTKGFVNDPHALKNFYINENKKISNKYHIEYDLINLNETRDYIKKEVDSILCTKGATYFASAFVPAGLGYKAVTTTAKTARLGKAVSKLSQKTGNAGKIKAPEMLSERYAKFTPDAERRGNSHSVLNKKDFYPEAQRVLEREGMRVTPEEDLIRLGKSWRSRPDFCGETEDGLIIGEIKSPAERPNSGTWRTPQESDTQKFSDVRMHVAQLERNGFPKEVGGWMIIIKGQVEDYARKMGKTWDVPGGEGKPLKGALTAPADQAENIKLAFKELGIDPIPEPIVGNGTVTFIWPLDIAQGGGTMNRMPPLNAST